MEKFGNILVKEKYHTNYVIEGHGFNVAGYPGSFTPKVTKAILGIIQQLGNPRVLHLFSGISQIGDVRVDLECLQATNREDVFSYIHGPGKDESFDLILLDPPYSIKRKSKLAEYAKVSSVAADVVLRTALADYFRGHTNYVAWLDLCCPLPKGFQREFLWIFLTGGYHTPRFLSLLKNREKPK